MSNWHGGKGSKRRNSNEQLYADNWQKIFGKEKPEIKLVKKIVTIYNSLFTEK